MTVRKLLTVTLTALLLTLTLTACRSLGGNTGPLFPAETEAVPPISNGSRAITVINSQGKKVLLEAGDYPVDQTDDPNNQRWHYFSYVRAKNDTLHVDNIIYTHYVGGPSSYTARYTVHYCGEWKGDREGVYLQGETVIAETCEGFLASFEGDRILIFTTREDTTLVYGAMRNGDTWNLNPQPLLTVAGRCRLLYLRWNSFNADCPGFSYLLTDKTVARIAVGDFITYDKYGYEAVTATDYETPDYWHHIIPSSATLMGDTLYIGDRFGVVALDTQKGDFTYFPILTTNP